MGVEQFYSTSLYRSQWDRRKPAGAKVTPRVVFSKFALQESPTPNGIGMDLLCKRVPTPMGSAHSRGRDWGAGRATRSLAPIAILTRPNLGPRSMTLRIPNRLQNAAGMQGDIP